eukprot:13798947-Alexandrium_andersonii.AAC.1
MVDLFSPHPKGWAITGPRSWDLLFGVANIRSQRPLLNTICVFGVPAAELSFEGRHCGLIVS